MLKTFKINKTISPQWREGSTVQLLCDERGIPEVPFWHDRYCDSKVDNCISEIPAIPRPDFRKEIEVKDAVKIDKPKKVARKKKTTNRK